ncbi:MAG: mechanosensitive ion channel domain-containing protein [Candidatus Babeliales bacterium]
MNTYSKKLLVIIIFFFLVPTPIAAGLFDLFKGDTKTDQQAPIFIAGGIEEKRHQVKTLEEEHAQLQEQEKAETVVLQENLDKVNKAIGLVKERLLAIVDQAEPDAEREREFLNLKLTKLNTEYQTLIDLQLSRKQRLTVIGEHITLLQNYLKEPTFKTVHIEKKAFYTFNDLQALNKRIADTEERLTILHEERNNTQLELDNRKRDLQVAQQVSKAKKQEQEAFSAKRTDAADLTVKQQGELLDLDETLFAEQQRLYEVQIKENQTELVLLETKIFIQESHLGILKDDLIRIVKQSVRVDNSDVSLAEEEFAKKKQASTEITKSYYQQVKNWTSERDRLKKELEALATQYNVRLEQSKGWDSKPDSLASWLAISDIGYTSERIALFDQQISLYKGRIDLEKEQLREEGTQVDIIKSWNSITLRKFTTDEEISKEKKMYEIRRSDMQRELNVYRDRRNVTTNLLNVQNKNLSKIRERIKEIKDQRNTVFKHDIKGFTRAINLLADAQKMVEMQVDLNGRLIDVYSSLTAAIGNSLKQVNSIIAELESISIWQRSIHAISWSGISNIVPDVEKFLVELRGIMIAYAKQWNINYFFTVIKQFFMSPLELIIAILAVFFLIALMFICHTYLPEAETYLLAIQPTQTGYLLSRFGALLIGFFRNYFVGMFIWSAFFILVRGEFLALALRIIFYLSSIPYLLYLTRRFIRWVTNFNQKYDYILLSEQFQKRFIQVFAIFAYSSIAIVLFREAFMLASYHKSELPTILLALYSLIFRTLLIFLIGKEEILSVIPEQPLIWTWLSQFIDKYYYLILIGIVLLMIASDPYIGGYGALVSYVLWGLVVTAILVRILILIHRYIKEGGARLFFDTSEDTLKERFNNAKTWYGLFLIFLFVVFVFLGLIVAARVWGSPITLEDIGNIFTNKLFSVGAGEDRQAISLSSFIEVILFMVGGFVTAMIINRFVLRKVFDLLLIESGVQNIVSIILRYVIVITAIVIGFQKVGLSSLLISIGVLIAGIGYMITEPIKDFASYFIILIQRPVKIGDYIKLENGQQGIVRKITPRAIILRAKNSYSIVVPNSQIVTQKVDNWNYTRNFIAFNDILLTVPYWVDPKRVREIMFGVLERHPDILKNPPPIIRLQNYDTHGYQFMVRGFLSSVNTLNMWDIASDIRFEIAEALQKDGIKLATPFTAVKIMPENFNPVSGPGTAHEKTQYARDSSVGD